MLSTSNLAVFLGVCASRASAWVIGTEQSETHPKMTWQRCTGSGGNSCTNVNGEIVIDANWRWLHSVGGYTNCFDGNEWNTTACATNAACTKNCAIEGSDYRGTYGITTSGNALTLKFVTKNQYSTNIGSRTYLMKDANNYEMFNLIGNEFTFDVDNSQLPCGLNGALYFVSMPQKGHGAPGAKYGTGYCDAQCARDLKYIDGKANAEGWQASESDPNAGIGRNGACCTEMDIWEANSVSTAVTPHSCQPEGYSVCTDDTCGGTYSLDRYAGSCDANGCDFNPYRVGARDFYGKGKSGVDTSKKVTVVTQFLGSGGSLSEIKRFYVQNGKVIANPEPTVPGMTGNSITQEWCNTQKEVFQEEVYPFNEFGGMESMGRGMNLGMVLVMSLWDDHYANMLWLDSSYPTDKDPEQPGVARGECDINSGVPADVESANPNAQVVFSNIKFGPIGSTFAQPA
ncbi:Esterase/lipase/thioesterase [Alternaria ethzedia]|uniref:Esterase/lipase/thioesterase n=1 Tax=Alternaria ethzedia TaxID=181014 RepID=UPI0020C33B07|nr:Esterase/lipase/thioesterase [Alternaria ethzedia]XP_051293102.1 Esterase/lipase/thioesterase [Alternaria incomplexa]KAI4635642.1 Esterase/lipase/thioesterase [Alternaria ethzedia]KAI4917130.1 Esterase/lipase/thioesterase [Alternaria incomplexa]